jgi:leucyl/phenylalanyl-tRNA--protein transferase
MVQSCVSSERDDTPEARVSLAIGLYREGWFPMGDGTDAEAEWVQPRRRSIIPLAPDRFRVTRSLRQRVRSGRFEVTSDTAFGEVIRACSEPRRMNGEASAGTWITPGIVSLFGELHSAGYVHSVEAWLTDAGGRTLVGGLYGVAIGRVFCGESMFSRPDLGGTDASRVCLVHLVEHLRERGFVMLDSQISNPHIAQFGAYEMPAERYVRVVREYAEERIEWGWRGVKTTPPPVGGGM